jgi:DNA-binding NarL/FixJ family response regulator
MKLAYDGLNLVIMSQSNKTPAAKARILLVDDHAVVRYAMTQLISRQPDMEVCGEEEGAARAMTAIATLKPDLIIADISLKDSSGLELMRNIKAQYPKLQILVFSVLEEVVYAEIAFRAGATGYLMKGEPMDRVLLAIRQVLSGEIYVSEQQAVMMLQKQIRGQVEGGASPQDVLSDRELEVFQAIGHWKGTRQIAGELHLSIKTIEYYREQVKKKLGLKTGAELTRAATAWVQREMPPQN